MGILVGWVVFSVIVGVAANTRGRSGLGWFLLALLFSPLLAGVFVLALGNASGARQGTVVTVSNQAIERRGRLTTRTTALGPAHPDYRLSPRPSSKAECPLIAGDGHYGVHVAGASHYQADLEEMAGGRTAEGLRPGEMRFAALVAPEPDNPYDPMAVRVEVRGRLIGYLERHMAAEMVDALAGSGYLYAACVATIVGGWDRGEDDLGNFGVRLDMVRPIGFRPYPRQRTGADHSIA